MPRLCITDESIENNRADIEKLYSKYWVNRDKNIFKVHGESEHSRKSFEEFGEMILGKPVNDYFLLDKGELARFDIELRQYDHKISKGFINRFEDAFFVQEGISQKDPVARFFYKELHKATNFERVLLSKAAGYQKSVARLMQDAYINNGFQGRWKFGNKYFERLEELAHKIKTSDNESDKISYENDLNDLVAVDQKVFGPSSLLGQFKDLMKITNAEFENPKLRVRDQAGQKTDQRYDPDVFLAASAARGLTNEMGAVTISGLRHMKEAVRWKLLGTNDPEAFTRNGYDSIEKAIDEAIGRVERGIEKGGYLPGYVMGDMIKIKESMSGFMGNQSTTRRIMEKELTVMEKALSSLSKEAIPDHAKPLQEKIAEKYEESPLFILQQYASDAVAFNKLSYTQARYLESMKRLSESKDVEWVRGMRKWIDEEYQISTEGLTSRDDWINNSVRTMMGVQVVRTMGLNFTGAVVNATSIQFAAAQLGFGKILNARHQYMNGTTATREKWRDIVNRVEERSGFLFNDVAAELVSEGLLPAEGINRSKYSYSPETGEILFEGSPLLNKMKNMGNWTVEKGLVFHRITENWTRKWMFRTAFMEKFEQLTSNPEYINHMEYGGQQGVKGQGYKAAELKSADWALEFVNKFAYEYAIHAKPKVARGIPAVDVYGDKVITAKVKAGALGQLAFQLTHYPFSLMQQQSKLLRGGVNALRAGQYNASELSYLYRYFALFSALQVGSILLNSDLNGMIPNETIEKFKQIEDDIMTPLDPKDDKMTYGLLSEFTGPTLGHMKFAVMASGVLGEDPSYIQQMLLGNVDYAKDEQDKYKWYQLSTEVGRWKTKIAPAIADGRGIDVFRHYFRMYPGELPYPGFDFTTKDARHFIGKQLGIKAFKKKPKKKKKKRQTGLNPSDVLSSLDKIDLM